MGLRTREYGDLLEPNRSSAGFNCRPRPTITMFVYFTCSHVLYLLPSQILHGEFWVHGFHARLWHVDTDFLCLLWSWLFFFYEADSHFESDLSTSDPCNDRVLLRTVLNESYCASAFMFLRKIEDFAVTCRRPRRETTYPRSCRPPLWVVTQERGKNWGGEGFGMNSEFPNAW